MKPDPVVSANNYVEDQSTFVSMCGQMEQMAVYNAMNFSRSIYSSSNSTVYATGIATLWCPSDAQIIGKKGNGGNLYESVPVIYSFTSYAGATGTWFPEPLDYGDCWVVAHRRHSLVEPSYATNSAGHQRDLPITM